MYVAYIIKDPLNVTIFFGFIGSGVYIKRNWFFNANSIIRMWKICLV